MPDPVDPFSLLFPLSLVSHSVLLLVAVAYHKRVPLLLLGVAWFYFALAPVSNLVPIFNPEADRYLYFPSIGFFLAIGAICKSVSAGLFVSGRYIAVTGLVLLTFWTGRTIVREIDWRDNQALWARELRMNPRNARAMTELAIEANRLGRFVESEKLSRDALAINNTMELARLQMARSLLMQRRHEEAFVIYLALLQKGALHPHHLAQAWFDMAYLLHRVMNDAGQAVTAYRNTLAVDPFHRGAAVNLAGLYMDRGEFEPAAGVCRESLKRFPDDKDLCGCLRAAEQHLREGSAK